MCVCVCVCVDKVKTGKQSVFLFFSFFVGGGLSVAFSVLEFRHVVAVTIQREGMYTPLQYCHSLWKNKGVFFFTIITLYGIITRTITITDRPSALCVCVCVRVCACVCVCEEQ